MSLFSSEIVQSEMKHIGKLYAELQDVLMRPNFKEESTDEEKRDVLEKMERLIELSEVLYTRVQLSDDPECVRQKEEYRIQAKQLGLPTTPFPSEIFAYARNSIREMMRDMGLDTQ